MYQKQECMTMEFLTTVSCQLSDQEFDDEIAGCLLLLLIVDIQTSVMDHYASNDIIRYTVIDS